MADDKQTKDEAVTDAAHQEAKPDDARAKDDKKAGNILAGVQPDAANDKDAG